MEKNGLRGTRCLKISEISPDFFAVREAYFSSLRGTRRMRRWKKLTTWLKYQIFIIIFILIFSTTTPAPPSKFSSSNTSNLCFKVSGTFRSHPGTFIRVQIIFLPAELSQIRISSLAPVASVPIAVRYQVNGDNTVRMHVILM
ncbi:hypothetical protein E3N88_01681 [Mikania micrantha]|uniref:Uncharacterized protein n=1 Tax=Mikania micrantha TaxID=192012 RepID=A0A5N6Q1M6_9ASTR|nr:hypothetical protein E3N88_01681 [Mikania micrantha]